MRNTKTISPGFFKPRVLGYLAVSTFLFLALGLLTEMRLGNLQAFRLSDLAQQFNFESFSNEDGPVETATVIFALAAGLLLIGAYCRCRKLGILQKPWHHAFLVLLVISLFVFAGEEVSWGQRRFGFPTPKVLQELNVQGEMNLHNIRGVNRYKDGIATILVFLWGVILPPAKAVFTGLRRSQQRIRLPVPPLEYGSLFAAAIGFRVVFKTLYGNFGQELFEFMFAMAMFFVALRAVKHPHTLYE